MIQVTRPVLIAAVAGLVAICAIAIAAWRLSGVSETPAPEVAFQAPGGAGPVAPSGEPPPAATSPPPSNAAPAAESAAASPPPAAPAPGVVGADRPEQSAAAPPPDSRAKPSFDVVRIDPTGDAVVAGRAEPRAHVELTLSGKTVAQAEADADGQFVMLPPKLPPGDHVLGLRATDPRGDAVSEQTVAIAVPAPGEQGAVAALTEPNKPTVVLSQSGEPGAGAPARDLHIASVEAQQGGALYASGVAPAGANLRLYLNEAFVASVEAGGDGKWSIRVERGMSPGAYRVRADRVGPDGRAVGRVEAPFDYPAALARQASDAPQTASASTGAGSHPGASEPAQDSSAKPGDAQNAVIEELRTARVERGDSLWRISRTVYGEGIRYTHIYDANTSQIRNPDLIYPGQVLVVPKQDDRRPGGEVERRD